MMRQRILTDQGRLIIYYSILVSLFSALFIIELTWPWGTFRTVVLAPLGEEPIKLLYAFIMLYASIFAFSVIPLILRNPISIEHYLSTTFPWLFPPFTVIACIIVGSSEAPLNSFSHIGFTTVGLIVTLYVFVKVKDKSWETRRKLGLMFVPIFLSMFLHSLNNQIIAIIRTQNNPGSLVIIRKFIVDYTFNGDTAFFYTVFIFIIGLAMMTGWYEFLVRSFLRQRKEEHLYR